MKGETDRLIFFGEYQISVINILLLLLELPESKNNDYLGENETTIIFDYLISRLCCRLVAARVTKTGQKGGHGSLGIKRVTL